MSDHLGLERLYDSRVDLYGYDPRSVGWKSTEQQMLRFKKLLEFTTCRSMSVMDLGCGFADLLDYLDNRKMNPSSYVGIEISQNMIEFAIARYENRPAASFIKSNFMSYDPTDTDIIFASGSLNYVTEIDKYFYLDLFLRKYASVCRKGLFFNLLTDKVDFQQPQHNHYNPKIVETMVLEYFKDYTISENYGLYEFTVSAWRDK